MYKRDIKKEQNEIEHEKHKWRENMKYMKKNPISDTGERREALLKAKKEIDHHISLINNRVYEMQQKEEYLRQAERRGRERKIIGGSGRKDNAGNYQRYLGFENKPFKTVAHFYKPGGESVSC